MVGVVSDEWWFEKLEEQHHQPTFTVLVEDV